MTVISSQVAPSEKHGQYPTRLWSHHDGDTTKLVIVTEGAIIAKSGKLWGLPYDWHKPTKARFQARMWNPNAPTIEPKAFGWGYTINFYNLFHPIKAWRRRHD
jgi:hypothetical protein